VLWVVQADGLLSGVAAMADFREFQARVRDVTMGDGVTVVQPVNLYECSLADAVFVGPFVEIQKGVRVGRKTRVQSHSFICELVSIGADCFIGHGVMFINDLFTEGGPSKTPAGWKATEIADRVSIGSNSTILPVRICSDVVIGAGSVVTRDILSPGVYAGNPARKLRSLSSAAVADSDCH
jgi:acetyltransferase-like isoleucine patch superfamily enzyme